MRTVYIGLMSGTSLDGIDGVAVDWPAGGGFRVLGHASAVFDSALRQAFLALNTSGVDELHRAALASNGLARGYAAVVDALLVNTGLAERDIQAIGAHGQTVRHRPGEFDGVGYTLQLNAPALLAELTGIDVVADFRSRDVAAGGQGAPLVPAFHRAAFGRPGEGLAVLNLGGIANLTAIAASGEVRGFDCGPANILLDAWCSEATGAPFDAGGAWAAGGSVDPVLLEALLAEPFFRQPPPKSSGRDRFNRLWLEDRLQEGDSRRRLSPIDIQATLSELTAAICAQAFAHHATDARELIVCGGGARNDDLLVRLRRRLAPREVVLSSERGLAPEHVEAAAFAWLARATVLGAAGNLPEVTGARGSRVLGAVYPGRRADARREAAAPDIRP